MKIAFSEEALNDLETVYLDGARKFGLDQADRYQNALIDSLELLTDFPMAHSERFDVSERLRAFRFRSQLIFYRIEDTCIRVIRVRHGREDWQD